MSNQPGCSHDWTYDGDRDSGHVDTSPGSAELAARTRRIHRQRFWGGVRYRAARPFMRALCAPRRHAHWARETMLIALASGRSKRCRWCNRLVLKPGFRR